MKSQFKGTPGPWYAHKPEDSNGYVCVDTDLFGTGTIATCYHTVTAKENATLIAAAPEMLAMLQAISDGVAVEDEQINLLIHKATTI